jgi:hypothetical protein
MSIEPSKVDLSVAAMYDADEAVVPDSLKPQCVPSVTVSAGVALVRGLFAGGAHGHYHHKNPGTATGNPYAFVDGPTTDAEWQRHLGGHYPGVLPIPIGLDNECWWMGLDYDSHHQSTSLDKPRLLARVAELGLRVLLRASIRR